MASGVQDPMRMDIKRQNASRGKLIKRTALLISSLAALPLIALGVARLKPAARGVDRATVWIDSVKRGPMLREVRGVGTLVPEEVLWIPAPAEGRVEKILVKPGAVVNHDTVLMVLRNPELETAAMDARYQVKTAEAQFNDLKVRLASERLNQQAAVARVESEFRQAKFKADADSELAKHGLLANVTLRLSLNAAEELDNRRGIEQKRLAIAAESAEAQLLAQQAQIDKLQAMERLKRAQVDSLTVRAGIAGVLQQLPLEVGQKVTEGFVIAKVAQPEKLKAELKISETQAKDIQLGQKASIDTRNGVIEGRVQRIDPGVKDGTITVDVLLEGELPHGARPDLSVDGAIELERLADVVYMPRPSGGQTGAVSLFRLEADGVHAVRVPVRLGRSSVNAVEVLEGLRPGNRVILSDTAQWNQDAVKLQ